MFKNFRCWWFGCEPHPQDKTPVEYIECRHCGYPVDYESMVGITRYNQFKDWCAYWFFMKWIPKKCECCGGRWKHDDSVDHIPF